MISPKMLKAVQKLGARFLTDTVVIHRRMGAAKDSSNPFGDDTISFETVDITVKGWVVPSLGKDFQTDASQVVTVGDHKLRVPAGTDIDNGDEVTISGTRYVVVDTSYEQTWPEWTVAFLKHAQ